jgi:hypothetical protein
MVEAQRPAFETAVVDRLKESGFLEVEIRVECLLRCDEGYQDEVINAGWHYWNAAIAAQPTPAPQSHVVGEINTAFVIEWIAAPRPPVHPDPMTGRQSYRSFDRAVRHMKSQAPDAMFVSLTERTTVTTTVDRSDDLRAALAAASEDQP